MEPKRSCKTGENETCYQPTSASNSCTQICQECPGQSPRSSRFRGPEKSGDFCNRGLRGGILSRQRSTSDVTCQLALDVQNPAHDRPAGEAQCSPALESRETRPHAQFPPSQGRPAQARGSGPCLRLATPASSRAPASGEVSGEEGAGEEDEGKRGHPRAPGCIVGRRRQRPGRAGGAPAAVAAVNPPGRSQHCGAASPARPRTAAPLLPLAAFRPPAPPPGAPASPSRPAGQAPLPGPDGRAGCPEEAGRGAPGRPAGGRRCRTSARRPTARGRARSRIWPSSGSRGIRPGKRPAPGWQPGPPPRRALPTAGPGRRGACGRRGERHRRRPQPRTPVENGPRAAGGRAAGDLGARAPGGGSAPRAPPEVRGPRGGARAGSGGFPARFACCVISDQALSPLGFRFPSCQKRVVTGLFPLLGTTPGTGFLVGIRPPSLILG